MLDGVNEESLSILKDIDSKKGSLLDISKWHGASLNQVNKLSRLNKLHKKSSEFLEVELLKKIKCLGMKALVLNNLIDDPSGLIEVLEVIDTNITRDELELYPKALNEKRKAVREKQQQANILISQLEAKKEELNNNVLKLKDLKIKSDKALKEFSGMSELGMEFILEHIGLFESKYILKSRLDIPWQQSLKKKGTIVYDNDKYVNYIVDIDHFKKSVERRIKNKNYMYYDTTRREDWSYTYPYDPEYKIGDRVIQDIATSIKEIKSSLNTYNLEKKKLNREISNLKKDSTSNYMQQAIISNTFSEKELIHHTKLQNEGLRFLYSNGYGAVTEISKDNFRFDVIGFDNLENIIIIEAKASISDFRQDNKMNMYRSYCNKLYLIMDYKIYSKAITEIEDKLAVNGIGLITVDNNKTTVKFESVEATIATELKEDLKFKVARKLSEKYIYSLNK